jgi:hypothetical protein
MKEAVKTFQEGNRVESLVEPVGEKGTVESISKDQDGNILLMSIQWDNLWRNAKVSISHSAVFTNNVGTEIFKLIG